MCELTNFTGLMIGAKAAILAAIAFIIAAAIANNSFFGAAGSPALMVLAGISTLAAIGLLAAAKDAALTYYHCARTCTGEWNNLSQAFTALMTVLSIQATACFIVAGIAWIPWAGGVPMYAILAALIVQLALIPTLIIFGIDFVNCVERAREGSPFSTSVLVSAVLVESLLITVVGIAIDPRSDKHLQRRRNKPNEV